MRSGSDRNRYMLNEMPHGCSQNNAMPLLLQKARVQMHCLANWTARIPSDMIAMVYLRILSRDNDMLRSSVNTDVTDRWSRVNV